MNGFDGAMGVLTGVLWYSACMQWWLFMRANDERWIVWGILANGISVLLNGIYGIMALLHHDYPEMGVSLGVMALGIWCIWMLLRRWKDRKRVMKLLGAKTKALRDKLVKNMKEGTQPRPVRVPS